MKKFYLNTLVLMCLLSVLIAKSNLYSQTAGNLSFSVTTTSTGGFSPDHLVAIWIESSTNAFIVTKILYSSDSNLDHLSNWTANSGGNTVDATTGATLGTHGTISFIWDGTNANGVLVPDGTYFVWVEMAWASSPTSGKIVTSYSFVKGPSAFNSSPAGNANLSAIQLTWTPDVATGIENGIENDDIRAFPNPTNGVLNIDFKQGHTECTIQVINDAGVVLYAENLRDLSRGIRTFNLGSLSPGIYYVTLHMPSKDISFRIVKMK